MYHERCTNKGNYGAFKAIVLGLMKNTWTNDFMDQRDCSNSLSDVHQATLRICLICLALSLRMRFEKFVPHM